MIILLCAAILALGVIIGVVITVFIVMSGMH